MDQIAGIVGETFVLEGVAKSVGGHAPSEGGEALGEGGEALGEGGEALGERGEVPSERRRGAGREGVGCWVARAARDRNRATCQPQNGLWGKGRAAMPGGGSRAVLVGWAPFAGEAVVWRESASTVACGGGGKRGKREFRAVFFRPKREKRQLH